MANLPLKWTFAQRTFFHPFPSLEITAIPLCPSCLGISLLCRCFFVAGTFISQVHRDSRQALSSVHFVLLLQQVLFWYPRKSGVERANNCLWERENLSRIAQKLFREKKTSIDLIKMLEYNDDTPKTFAVWASANTFSPRVHLYKFSAPIVELQINFRRSQLHTSFGFQKKRKNYSPPIKLRCDKFFLNVKLYKI